MSVSTEDQMKGKSMKEYEVTIKENLEMKVIIEAENEEEAISIAEENYWNSEYILDADCFKGVEFSAEGSLRESEKSVRNRKDYSR